MTTATISVSNFRHFKIDDENTLGFGKLSVNINDTNTFQIEGNIQNDTNIIFTNQNSDNNFKNQIINLPLVNKYSVTLYDYSKSVTNRYLKDRVDNKPGNVSNKLSKLKLLSQIKVPCTDDNELTYLVIENYEALNEVLLIESQNQLINQDWLKFLDNNKEKNMKEKVILFITDALFNRLSSIIKLDEYFKDVKVYIDCVTALNEHLFGRIISSSNQLYQDKLYFYENVEVGSVLVSSTSKTSITARSEGVIQINTFNGSSDVDFICFLEHKSNISGLTLKNYESKQLISKSEELRDSDTSINFEYINQFYKNYLFYNHLVSEISKNDKLIWFHHVPSEVIGYLFVDLTELDCTKYNGDLLELLHLSNIDYIKNIQNNLKDMINYNNSYPHIKQFNIQPVSNMIALQRQQSV